MKKTKIVCTLGPATDSIIKELIETGMNVARFNFSHGTHEEHLQRVNTVKTIREELQKPVSLLLDTRGPEIRVKKFENDKVIIKADQTFTLTTEDITGNEERVSITYKNLPNDVTKGDTILIDDGLIELKVVHISDTEIDCDVLNGGQISNNKGVNVPGVTIGLPFVSEQDKKDIIFGIKNEFDYIAASFTRSSNDIKDLKKVLDDNNDKVIQIISKIENRDGVNNIDDILRVSDGIMVARGDMGVEIPFEELPAIQKNIISKCNLAGKPVITATQMLDSMIRNPRPTRAEITDVANAIYDGTSAIMLSGETSIGKYPLEAVETMRILSEETEKDIDYVNRFSKQYLSPSRNVTNAISHATCSSAHLLGASAIISLSKSGHSARMVSKYRPASPIIALTTSIRAYNQLALSWGVFPVFTETKNTTDELFAQAIRETERTGIVKSGDLIVMTGGLPVGMSGTTNTMKIHVIGDVLIHGKGINEFTATGPISVVDDSHDIQDHFNEGDILVIKKTSDYILPIIKYASALITEENERDAESVIVGKALEIPVISDAHQATSILKSGIVATVDASKGLVYSGNK